MNTKKDLINFSARLPDPDMQWLKDLAAKNCTSLNAELIRAVREWRKRMEADQAKAAQ